MENNIAQTFKSVRLARKESQAKFASILGRSRVSISNYETGKAQPGADIYEKVLQLRELLFPEKEKEQ